MRLLGDVWKESHEASTLYSCFNCTLLFGSESTALAADHAAVRIYELLQEFNILVVDMLDVILCEYVCHNKIY